MINIKIKNVKLFFASDTLHTFYLILNMGHLRVVLVKYDGDVGVGHV